MNLASIDFRTYTPTESQMRPYSVLLNRLSTRCNEERTMIADMVARSMQNGDFGRDVTVRDVLEELDTATENLLSKRDCQSVLYGVIIFLKNPRSR